MAQHMWVLYRGGPKDGQVLRGAVRANSLLSFEDAPGAYYRLSGETASTDKGVIPVADWVGGLPLQQ